MASSITIENATKTESAGVNQSLSKILSLSENTEPVQQPEAQPEEPNLNLSQVQLDSNTLTYGNENARFSLVTYMDFQCPYCQRFASTPKTLVDKANGGLVNWKWKNSPLPFHEPNATDYAGENALCWCSKTLTITGRSFQCGGIMNLILLPQI
ncbi:DsbA family protein [Providencia hangzhouensis]